MHSLTVFQIGDQNLLTYVWLGTREKVLHTDELVPQGWLSHGPAICTYGDYYGIHSGYHRISSCHGIMAPIPVRPGVETALCSLTKQSAKRSIPHLRCVDASSVVVLLWK